MLKRERERERERCTKQQDLYIPSKTATLVPKYAVEDLPLDRTATLFPAFIVKDLPLGGTLNYDDDPTVLASSGGSVSSNGKALSYGLHGLVSIAGRTFASVLCVKTGPGVHSSSCKMSTGAFPRGKDG